MKADSAKTAQPPLFEGVAGLGLAMPHLMKSARAKLRVMVKRTLRKYDYPPDKQKKATDTVIQQAELLGEGCAGEGGKDV